MKQAIMIYTNQQPQSLEIEASLKDKLELAGFRLVEPGQGIYRAFYDADSRASYCKESRG